MSEFESVCVHLFDGIDPNFVNLYSWDDGRKANYMTTYKKLISFGTSAGDIITWIKQQIGPNKIHVMRIVAHGDSGAFFLGKVYTKDNIFDWWTLRGCFDPAARVELHSCAVASDIPVHTNMLQPGGILKRGKFSGNSNGQGVKFMGYLAASLNAKVVASIDDHRVGINTWSMHESAMHNTVTVLPNGTIQTQALNPMVPD